MNCKNQLVMVKKYYNENGVGLKTLILTEKKVCGIYSVEVMEYDTNGKNAYSEYDGYITNALLHYIGKGFVAL
jgi:peptide deformylase